MSDIWVKLLPSSLGAAVSLRAIIDLNIEQQGSYQLQMNVRVGPKTR